MEIMKALYFIAKNDLEKQVTISSKHWSFKFPHSDKVKAVENDSSEEGETPEETKRV